MIQQKLFKPAPPANTQYDYGSLAFCQKLHPIFICFDPINKKPVPLRNVHYNLNVQQGLVVVEMIQEYSTQDFDKPIDIEYTFIVNQNATVTKMVVEIGDEKKYGIIKEKVEAKIEYEEGIKQGKTMAYSDQDEQIPEMKKVKIGALSPNQTLKIIFEYVQPLEVFLNKYWKIEISPLIDPFYFKENEFQNYSIDQQKLNKKIRQLIQLTQTEFNYQQNISIEINNGSIITSYKSPTHKIITAAKDFAKLDKQENNQKKLKIMLEDTPENYKPNKQFILLFSSDEVNLPRAILTHTNQDALQAQTYCATLTLIPKFNETSLDDAYQQYLDGMNIVQDGKINRGNYLFFIDRSGSMQGSRIGKAKEALSLFLKSLPENSYFNIISFGSEFTSLWSESKQYSQQTLDEAINHVNDMTANMGGTEIYQCLSQVVYNQGLINKYQKLQMTLNVFLLTDGETDAIPIINLISQNQSADIRIYSLGIGDGCSQYLIKKVAEVGNGKYHIMSDNEDLNAKVIDLLEDSLTSYLKAFKLETNAANISTIIPAPDSIVSLKKNQELMIQVMFSPEQQNKSIELNLSCFDPQEQKSIKYNITLNIEESTQNEYYHKIAAHRFIKFVEESMNESKKQINQIDYQQNVITTDDLINICIQHQILSSKTAFVCEVCNLEDQFKQQKREKLVINKSIQKQQQNPGFGFSQNFNHQNSAAQSGFGLPMGAFGTPPFSYGFQCQGGMQMVGSSMPMAGFSRPMPGASMPMPGCSMQMPGCSMPTGGSMQMQGASMAMGFSPFINNNSMPSNFQPAQQNQQQQSNFQQSRINKEIQQTQINQNTEILKQLITYQELVSFVQADGSFDIPIQIQIILKVQEFSENSYPQLVYFTMVSLFYLELFCADSKHSWQLVYSKAVSFLQKHGIEYKETKAQLIEKYKGLMQK